MGSVVGVATIQQRILFIRGEKIIIDADLAAFFGVPTKRLNEQVKRNRTRFPVDFMFRLTPSEKAEVVANCDHLSSLKFSKALPFAFTEHGAIMAASVLNSKRAVEVSVFVVRAFVGLRQMLRGHRDLAENLDQLERRVAGHDETILALVRAIKALATPRPVPKKRRIGFRSED